MLETLGSEKWPKVGASDRAFLASRQLRCGGFSLLQAPPSWNPYVALITNFYNPSSRRLGLRQPASMHRPAPQFAVGWPYGPPGRWPH